MSIRDRVLVVGIVLASPAAIATTRRVPEEHAAIQSAIDSAEDGDQVLVGPGAYEVSEPIVFRGKGVQLKSVAGPGTTTLRMVRPLNPDRGCVVAFEQGEPSSASVEGFTITGGTGRRTKIKPFNIDPENNVLVGGGIYVGVHVEARINNNVIRDNSAEYGGGVFCDVDSLPVLAGNQILSNRTIPSADISLRPRGGGLACMSDSTVTIGGGVFAENSSSDGGAIHAALDTIVDLINVRFEGNSATDDGGAVHFLGSAIRAVGDKFQANDCLDQGGAFFVHDFGATGRRAVNLVIEDCAFEQNRGLDGGALYIELSRRLPPATPHVSRVINCSFLSNSASGMGGAYSAGYESGTTQFEGCRFERNDAPRGGAVYLGYESLNSFDSCQFLRNFAVMGGGAHGDEESNLVFNNCVLSGNTASWVGGAMSFGTQSAARLLNHCTIAGNSAGFGSGGIHYLGGFQEILGEIRSSILWDNPGPLPGAQAQVQYSCIEGSAVAPGVGNINKDPQFAGWPGAGDVHVDPSREPAGDGTPEKPFRDLTDALSEFGLELVQGSPCIGAGEGGTDIGASTGTTLKAGLARRSIHLSPGQYRLHPASLAHRVSLLGSGVARTYAEGPALGLRSGARLEGINIIRGKSIGISVPENQSPLIRDCIVTGIGPDASLGYMLSFPLGTFGLPWVGGIFCGAGAAPTVEHCTIAGNGGGSYESSPDCRQSEQAMGTGIYSYNASPTLESCIVWGNLTGSMRGRVAANRSCIESSSPWPGESNTNAHPLFEAWKSGAEIHVDSAAPAHGDGSPAAPFAELLDAVADFSFALVRGSPCIGTGWNGSDMGATVGVVEQVGSNTRRVLLAPGHYFAPQFDLNKGVSVVGAGPDATVIHGSLSGLRSGQSISDVKLVEGGTRGALSVGACESPDLSSVVFENCFVAVNCEWGNASLKNCEFLSCNYGILAKGSNVTIDSCRFQSVYGGVNAISSEIRATNSLFVGTFVAMTLQQSSGFLQSCTIDGTATEAIQCEFPSSSAKMQNCIVSTAGAGLCGQYVTSLRNADPHFVQRATVDFGRARQIRFDGNSWGLPDYVVTPGDYHLLPDSIAIDKGSLDGAPAVDIEGTSRSCGNGPDIGCYEQSICAVPTFRRGDATSDGKIDLTDAVFTLNYLFTGGVAPACLKAADANDTGSLDLSDPIGLLRYLFLGAAAPAAPFPECGDDATADALTCAAFAPCAP